MPINRNAPVFAGFVKITEHGQGIAGRLDVVRDISTKADKVELIAVFSPAIVYTREGKGNKAKVVAHQWKAVTINMSGDLRRKIDTGGKDQGKFFSVIYKDDEPVPGKPDPMKIFNVDEYSRKEFTELWNEADPEHKDEPYPQAEKKNAPKKSSGSGSGDGLDGADEDEGDDLPF